MTSTARHAVHNGPTAAITTTHATAVRVEPWQPSDPAAYRLAAAAHREAGDAAELVARLEARCDRLTAGLIAVAAVAVFAVAALAFTWARLL